MHFCIGSSAAGNGSFVSDSEIRDEEVEAVAQLYRLHAELSRHGVNGSDLSENGNNSDQDSASEGERSPQHMLSVSSLDGSRHRAKSVTRVPSLSRLAAHRTMSRLEKLKAITEEVVEISCSCFS